ncbi:MAG: hypothetical protein K6T72_02735 [Anoxybacillus sp.]|nr:hypothetical protein [Anoxybacillus sp.]MCL6585421.1 hypothetical protein [Anoxybacillus sp.]
MMRKLLKTYCLMVLLFAACDDNEDSKQISSNYTSEKPSNQVEKNNKADKEVESVNASESKLSLEKQFLPPNFLVQKLSIEAKNRSIKFVMDYVLSEKLYEVLEQYKDYYFMIEYPEELFNLTNVKKSKPVKGPLPKNGQLSNSVTIVTSWNNDIPNSLMHKINKGELRYNLIILDKEMFPVHIFNDVQWYQTFDPNKGFNIIIDDKKTNSEN